MCIYMYTRERERERDRQTDRKIEREGGQREVGFPCGDGRLRPIVTPRQRVLQSLVCKHTLHHTCRDVEVLWCLILMRLNAQGFNWGQTVVL